MNNLQNFQQKDDVMHCIRVCGGITGYTMGKLCPDEEVKKNMLLDGDIRKFPAIMKNKKGEVKTITFYEMAIKTGEYQSIRADASTVRQIAYLNRCYLEYKDKASRFFDLKEIKTYVKNRGFDKYYKFMPHMIFLMDDDLYAVFVHTPRTTMDDDAKAEFYRDIGISNIIEYVTE